MNIKDFDAPEIEKNINYAEAIFHRQQELIDKYHIIEVNNGFVSADMPTPVDIDDRFAQYRIKDFCWRVTEELMEAMEAFTHDDMEHYIEECIDALHFITELCINVGLEPRDIYVRAFSNESDFEALGTLFPNVDDPILFTELTELGDSRDIPEEVLEVVYWMGLAANTLKNKPWKQSHISTDDNKFRMYMSCAYIQLIFLLGVSGLTSKDIYEVYYKKSEVNKFRQRSNY